MAYPMIGYSDSSMDEDTTLKIWPAPLMETDHRAKPAMVDGLKKFDNSRVGIAVWI